MLWHGLGKQNRVFFQTILLRAWTERLENLLEFQQFNELGAAVPVVQTGPMWFVHAKCLTISRTCRAQTSAPTAFRLESIALVRWSFSVYLAGVATSYGLANGVVQLCIVNRQWQHKGALGASRTRWRSAKLFFASLANVWGPCGLEPVGLRATTDQQLKSGIKSTRSTPNAFTAPKVFFGSRLVTDKSSLCFKHPSVLHFLSFRHDSPLTRSKNLQ